MIIWNWLLWSSSGQDTDKSNIFKVFYGVQETAPMITECPLSVDSKLFDVLELPTNDIFIGEGVCIIHRRKIFDL